MSKVFKNGVAPKFPCPQCGEVGAECSVKETTCVGNFPFKDKDGNAHYHEENCISVYARCTAGHFGYVCAGYFWCECGWSARDKDCQCRLATMKSSVYPSENS